MKLRVARGKKRKKNFKRDGFPPKQRPLSKKKKRRQPRKGGGGKNPSGRTRRKKKKTIVEKDPVLRLKA